MGAGAVIALARASGLVGTGQPVSVKEVADDLDVTFGSLTLTERELACTLNLPQYAQRPPAA